MQPHFVFSSESVTAGHPDKVCDRISDAIVDRHLRQDPAARVNAECVISTGIVFLSVKARSSASVDSPAAAREVLRAVGYTGQGGFDPHACTIMTSLYDAPDTSSLTRRPVNEETLDESALEKLGANDQATVFGYACSETPCHMPLPIWLAHRLAQRLSKVQPGSAMLTPDGKTQVAVEYRDRRPARIHSITLLACQYDGRHPKPTQLSELLRDAVIGPAFADLELRPDERTEVSVNPQGPVVPGGPVLHAGLTGRKTAVDGYGDFARSGAAALSGKDPSRIDRVGSYAARHAARNVVAAGLAERCEVQLSYAIGHARPVSVLVDTFDTGRLSDAQLLARIEAHCDFRPAAIVRRFGLRSLPQRRAGSFYQELAAYGQVGREDLELPWEQLDYVDALRHA